MILLLSGCWPYIPGTWEDYDGEGEGDADADSDGDSDGDGDVDAGMRIVGELTWNEYIGGYWDDDIESSGLAYFHYLSEPDSEHTAFDLGYIEEGCLVDPDYGWAERDADDPGDSAATLSGNPEIELEWLDEYGLYGAVFDDKPAGTYDLDDFEADGDDRSVEGIASMPSPMTYDTDLFDGDELQSAGDAELDRVTWSGGKDDLFAVLLYGVVDNSDGIIQYMACVAPAEDGRMDVDIDNLDERKGSNYITVAFGTARETVADIEGGSGVSRMLATRWKNGAVKYE